MEIKRVLSDQLQKLESSKTKKIRDEQSVKQAVPNDTLKLSDTAKTYSEAVEYAKKIDNDSSASTKRLDDIKQKVSNGYYSKNEEVLEKTVQNLLQDLV